MAGKSDMDLFGWKQLILWSIYHACLDKDDLSDIMDKWEEHWDTFLDWIDETYGNDNIEDDI
jgi:adenosine deaminase CECR1